MAKRVRAVDLDGTLAKYNNVWDGTIGEPVPLMVQQVKDWLIAGDTVIILTARVALMPQLYFEFSKRFADELFVTGQKRLIERWCLEHIGVVLEVTAQKDHRMTDFYDDRAWRVEQNTGRIIGA